MATTEAGTDAFANGNDSLDGGIPSPQDQPSSPPPVQPTSAQGQIQIDAEAQRLVSDVMYSDIGVSTLLTRLKQSIASARNFAGFLKKRSSLEEEHANGLKKLCKSTHDAIRSQDARQGTYARQMEEVTRVQERMAENGVKFALSLHHMHDDLSELAGNMERGRKQWKSQGLAAEKKVTDAEAMMEKAKHKYDSLAEDYDRARTGDKSAGRVFGLKGPKSAAQHEEDLHRKVQAADADYASKVQNAQTLRQELINSLRPQAVKAIQELITECDSALVLQVQKYVAFNERLLLDNGMLVSPVPITNSTDPVPASLREIVAKIDNDKDFQQDIVSHVARIPQPKEIKYEKHPTLATPTTAQPTPPSMNRRTSMQITANQPSSSYNPQPSPSSPQQNSPYQPYPTQYPSTQNVSAPSPSPYYQPQPQPPSYDRPPYPTSASESRSPYAAGYSSNPMGGVTPTYDGAAARAPSPGMPPVKPVFGLTLEELFRRDGTPVPMVVYQCIQAVDLFGLDVEGIYRMSGNANHVQALKAQFDYDAQSVDFRNPEAFYHDVNSVTGLLKQFLRELPDPVLTRENYQRFIEAARIDDDTTRRDALHALINELPDPHYATLRALVLHLHRVLEHQATNRMSAGNLAVCIAPTLMGDPPGTAGMLDMGLQPRVVETVVANALQIFDED